MRDCIFPELGFLNSHMFEGFEADDIIAKAIKPDELTIIATSDKDLYQLLTHKTYIFNLLNNKFFTIKQFVQKYGISPEDWIVVKAIGGCFDKETEILTNRGWVFFYDLKFEDLVYSMDPITQISKYEKITNIIKYRYNGDMYKFYGTLVDMLVTPDHPFFGNTTQSYNKTRSRPKVLKAKEILNYKNFSIPLTSKWDGTHKEFFIIPERRTIFKNVDGSIREIVKKEIIIDMRIWLSFLGIWLADGHTAKNKNGKIGVVGISKQKEYPVKKIQEVLDKTPFRWLRVKTGWTTNSVQLASYLEKLGVALTKFIPQEFKDLSTDLLKYLFDNLILCDGWVSTKKYTAFGNNGVATTVGYCSSSKQLIDDVQEIAVKLGYCTNIYKRVRRKWKIKGKEGVSNPNYILRINKSKTANLLRKNIDIIRYDDFVYDVTTEPNHTIFVRRNGKAVWSSNCSSDNVSGVKGVGESTAIKYIRGELPSHYQKFSAIENSHDHIIENLKLVALPFEGTPDIRWRKNDLTMPKFIEFCKTYNFELLAAINFQREWEEYVCNR
jgi:hypothetical protein